VRSPHAFARIREIDTSAAAAMPGVLAIVTGADVKAAGVGSASKPPIMDGRNGSKLLVPFRPVLATDRVMHVGDCVALVVAETRLAAQDAAESVMVDYEEFEPAVDLATVGEEGAAQLFPEVPRNLVFDWTLPAEPDKLAEVDAIVAAAHRTASVRVGKARTLSPTSSAP